MKTKVKPQSNLTCLFILLLSLVSTLSVHAKDRDFTVFLKDLDTLLTETTLEDEINRNKRSTAIKSQKTPNNTLIEKPENIVFAPEEKKLKIESKVVENKIKEKTTTHHVICSDKNRSTLKISEKENNNNNANENSSIESIEKETKTAYWDKLHFIESSAGKRLYRKRNKARSCKWTTTPCGHHQLSVTALKDIGCTSLKCRSAREDYKKSLSMSKQLAKVNAKRMRKKGYKTLPDYQQYLVHQQGAYGLGTILDALNGKKTLSKKTLRYMANNSPFSYKNLRRSGSKGAARKFLRFWKEKWDVKMSKQLASR